MNLTANSAAALEEMLKSAGWTEVFEPYMRKRMVDSLDQLTALKRPAGLSDDILRGRIDEDKVVLSAFRQMLLEFARDQEETAAVSQEPIASPYAKDNPSQTKE